MLFSVLYFLLLIKSTTGQKYIKFMFIFLHLYIHSMTTESKLGSRHWIGCLRHSKINKIYLILLKSVFSYRRLNTYTNIHNIMESGICAKEELLLLQLLLSRFSHVRLCVIPETAAHQASPSLGFSRQEHWSGLPFPSPMHESEKLK